MYGKQLAEDLVKTNTWIKLIATIIMKIVTSVWKHFLILQKELAIPSAVAPQCPVYFTEYKISTKG